jgi:hypothetical protein
MRSMAENDDKDPTVPGAGFDPVSMTEEWVQVAHAAKIIGTSESWILELCRDGRLPSRPVPGRQGAQIAVPLSTARALAVGRISE